MIVGGLPGTGKSTLAAAIADATGAVLLRSDEIRKELAGLNHQSSADAPFGEGIYTGSMTCLTYETMLSRAGVALGMGEPVVLDASWSTEAWRNAARALAARTYSDVIELRCDAPPAVAADRIGHRRAIGGDPSDATPHIATIMAQAFDHWPNATRIDTTGEPAASVDQALANVFHRDPRTRPDAR